MKFIVTFRNSIYTVGAYRVAPSKPIEAVVISDYTITGNFLTCTTTDYNRKMIIPLDNILGLCESFE
ncbi:hypothetical protein BEL04_20940 [Mucilaginibacter sp. PPCGB 2223]|uniref:hypothetical protein n=1 Tax=Mucilaginibacter sp. PPCGB 2223 TaxID=1886027 RepID=UPI0008254757|nr:hypothetical protein [Mucilaginibacter sp. PPCGB 2223]OCX51174.1 hypothetical protein BEL04_20940 [Mucilaginibacter sp. PPCGB 2223]